MKVFFFLFFFNQAVSYRSELISLKHYLPLTFILYFTCFLVDKKRKEKHLGVTWQKAPIELKPKCGLCSDVLRYRLDYVCMLGQPVSRCKECRVYLPDTDFPVLLMHSCLTWLQWVWSERLWLLAAQKQKKIIYEFYCCRLLGVSGQYRKCSTCVEVSNMVFTLG